jgi:hypothetical protein
MDEQLKEAIRQLCNHMEATIDEGGWDGVDDEQVVMNLIAEIRDGIAHL